MNPKFQRLAPCFGEQTLERIQQRKVLLIGLGGVGGIVGEVLARSGISTIGICDGDRIEASNFNRQILALDATEGMLKTSAMRGRIQAIHPEIEVIEYPFYVAEETIARLELSSYDLVLDCIDDVRAKVLLIELCKKEGIEILSAMGTANKSDPNGFCIADIRKTCYCPLAKRVRYELRKRGISDVKVCFSKEPPAEHSGVLASQMPIVGSAGFVIAQWAITYLASLEERQG